MSAAALAERPEGVLDASDDQLGHLYCCDDAKALCGADIGGVAEAGPGDEINCVVCLDIEPSMRHKPCASPTCPRRGAS